MVSSEILYEFIKYLYPCDNAIILVFKEIDVVIKLTLNLGYIIYFKTVTNVQ